MRKLAIAAVGLLIGCGSCPPAARSQEVVRLEVTTPTPVSVPYPPAPNGTHVDFDQVPIAILSGMESPRRAAISALTPYPPEGVGWYSLVLEGADDPFYRTLPVYMPASPSLHVGDLVEVRSLRVPVGGVAYDEAVELLDAQGQLLAASFTGSASLSGWQIAPSETSSTGECQVRILHAGTEVTAIGNEWRRFMCTDGSFAVSLQCPRPNPPEGGPVPDDWAPDPLVVRVSRLAS